MTLLAPKTEAPAYTAEDLQLILHTLVDLKVASRHLREALQAAVASRAPVLEITDIIDDLVWRTNLDVAAMRRLAGLPEPEVAS